MAMNKTLEVLCLNGRRQKVKTTPSTTILQVLQEVCKKQGFISTEVDLIHQRKVLDVTATMRYTNIPNNGKLEMSKRSAPRKASNVNLVIQLENGERLQHHFHPSTTLYDVLKQMEGDPGSLHHGKILCNVPVIIYMTHKISGINALRQTTLENLGLIGGNAVLRLGYTNEENGEDKNKEDSGMKDPFTSQSSCRKNSLPIQLKEHGEPISSGSHSAQLPSYESRTDTCVTSGADEPSKQSRELIAVSSEEAVEPLTKRQKLPEAEPNTKNIGCGGAPESARDAFTDEHIQRIAAETHPFAQFKFPETTDQHIDEDTIEAIDPRQIMKEERLSMPCDRRPCIFDLNNIQLNPTHIEEPDDSFYEHTVEDLRLRVQGLKHLSTEDAPFLTKNMRAAKNMEKAFHYKEVVLRIQFPGRIILQGVFRPLEKVKAIQEFVAGYLQDESFVLYTTPPKCVLEKLDQTLHEAKLIPTALVHVACNDSIGNLLKRKPLDSSKEYLEAEKIAFEILKKSSPHTSSDVTSIKNHDADGTKEDTATGKPAASEFMESKRPKSSGGKVPKWLKTGIK